MKPALLHLPVNPKESFVARSLDYKYYPTPWHFHPEYELILVTESTGKRFIGDNISDFKPGDLLLLGPNLPHVHRNDAIYYKPGSKLHARIIVVHFLESAFGEQFHHIPETKALQKLFSSSVRGLQIVGKTNTLITAKMHELCELKGFSRWLKLLDILNCMTESNDLRYISAATVKGLNDIESARLNTIFEFAQKNFKREIQVSEIASIVNLAENSFSRFFSQRTRKTFTSFVNEIRLHHASKLLIENEMSVAEICYECGFNNLSNFNRQFRNVYQANPLAYRKQYLNKA
ncbi:MAG: AraC family transcriptional regulator [Flavitalea sp.]